MTQPQVKCVLLADRHHGLIECVRDMLETEFAALFIVADENSLIEGATRLRPTVVIVDTSLVPGRLPELLHQLRSCSPHTKTLLLSVHDEANVARFGLEARADGVVLKRAIATDLLVAIDAVLANRCFVSPGISQTTRGDASDTGE
jgi:DNA-binding NarL/FixJ family response regulator